MTKRDLLLTSISAILFSLAFPPLRLGFLIYFFLIPLFFVLRDKSWWDAFKIGYVFGLITNSLLLFWVGWATVLGTIGAILILNLYTAILFALYAFLEKQWKDKAIFLLPFLWISMEYIRGEGVLAFPWLDLAHTQTYYLQLIQYASLTAQYGISFWILCLNIIIYLGIKNAFQKRKMILASIVFLIFWIVPYIYGNAVMPKEVQKGDIKIALLQGNIDPYIKWDERYSAYNFETYFQMCREAGKEKPDLIIWPETAAPIDLAYDSFYLSKTHKLTDSLNIPMLLGTEDYSYSGGDKYLFYNSAFLFKPQKNSYQSYAKIHLVPFSERIPFLEVFPFLSGLQLGQSEFYPGKEFIIFEIPQGKFATLICFESIFPDLVRDFVRGGAEFLVNITNDGWFGKTSGPYQHAQIAIFRAIENRIWIARCANTGVSMFIDPYGRTYNKTKIFVRDNVVDTISLKKEKDTFYIRYGDWFPKGCLIVSAFIILGSVIRSRRNVPDA